MNLINNALIIGAGEIGQTIKTLIGSNAKTISFWDKDPARISTKKNLDELLDAADAVFFCVPSSAMREAILSAASHLKKETAAISLAKGIEEKTLKIIPDLFDELLPISQSCAVLGGPMLAQELNRGLKGRGILAIKDKNVFDEINQLFKNSNLDLEYSADLRGVALAGVLKNIYAIALGIAQGLDLGDNIKGWLVSKSIEEMQTIFVLLNQDRELVSGTAGLADLVATGFNSYSRNRTVGYEIGRSGKCLLQSEGVIALPSIKALIKNQTNSLILFNVLEQIIFNNKDPKIAFGGLIGDNGS